MRIFRLTLCLCLLLCSCREKPAATPPPAPSPAAPAASPTPVPIPMRPTPAQVGSVVRVRIAFGGLPARDASAALLHRSEIPYATLARGRCRCVLAPLKGWSESQLRDASAVLIVYRDRVDRIGRHRIVPHPARLVQFDASAGVGILAYADDFDYVEDVGFRLPHGVASGPDLLLLRTSRNVADGGPAGGADFSVDAGTARRTAPDAAAPLLPALEPGATADPALLVVSGPDVLTGFLEGGSLQGLDGFTVTLQPPRFDAAQVTFDLPGNDPERYNVHFLISSAWGDPLPKRVDLALRAIAPGTDPGKFGPDAGGGFLPVSDKSQFLWNNGTPPDQRTISLPLPAFDERAYCLMQLTWPLLDLNDSPELVSQPMVVQFERRAGKVAMTLLDQLPAANAGPTTAGATTDGGGDEPAAVGEAVRFPLEGAALDVHLIAGGREALIHLDAAPYWRRFSFEKKDWLPLPPGTDRNAAAAVTGNLTALFVLDRRARELHKYSLPDLQPAAVVRLPPADYLDAVAGSESEHTPVYLPTTLDTLIVDPGTLQPLSPVEQSKPGPPPTPNAAPRTYLITGDGLGLRCYKEGGGPYLHYNNRARGLEPVYQGVKNFGAHDWVPGVTAGFGFDAGLRTFDAPGGKPTEWGHPSAPWTYALSELAENAPVVFRVLRPETRRSVSVPPRLGCFALPGHLPFAEVDVPELSGLHDRVSAGFMSGKRDRWVFFDPFSLRLATLATDRRTWYVRTIAHQETRRQPVLLNWPDTTVARGESLTFRPLLLGGKRFTATVLGKTAAPKVDETAGTLTWPVAPLEFDSLQLLDFSVPGADGTAFSYPVALHVAGPELPFVTPPGQAVEGLNQRGASVASLGESDQDCRPLPASLYDLPETVSTMVGPVSDCVVLATAAGRLDFFSLSARRIVGSTVGPAGACYYPGPGALLEYDPGKRTLTRISVPDGRREATLAVPPFVELRGVGSGTDRDSPVTLSADVIQSQSVLHFSDLTLTEKDVRQFAVVLDGRTLRAQGHAQPVSLASLLGQREETGGNSFAYLGVADPRPAAIPTSRNGCMVNLPLHFLALGPAYAVAYPFAAHDPLNRVASLGFGGGRAGGSLSGLMAFSGAGQAYKGGIPVGGAAGYLDLGSSPDGCYQFRLLPLGTTQNEFCVDIRAAENDQPLLRLARLAFLDRGQFNGEAHQNRRFLTLGDHGPLAVLSAPGRTLELVDLDIAEAVKGAIPQEFHVVSQPPPYVMEGRTMQYQVRVNNADAVQSYALQNAVPGAKLSPAGMLTYTAPASITAATRVTISIEIRGKNGQVVLHEFPVCVLPLPRTVPQKPATI